MQRIRYSFPTEIFFGAGCVQLLREKLPFHGCKRPLLVTDKGLSSLPLIARMKDILSAPNMATEIFCEVVGNPLKSQVAAGVNAYRIHEADSVVAIGGGAALDVAKAIGLMVNHPGDLFDYEDDKSTRPINQPIPFIVAIPTTSGTGSEVGRSAVISDDTTKVKKIIFSPQLLPKLVLLDPELTLELPPSITASTGMDALSHLAESFLVDTFHPICDGIAIEGLRLLGQSLSICVRGLSSGISKEQLLYQRGLMMNAAMMGAVAFQKGLGITHSCAHALSAVCDTHHGLANGVMLPYAMAFNESRCVDKFKRIETALQTSLPFVSYLWELQKEIGIPSSLKEIGVGSYQISTLAQFAIEDACHLSNPRPVLKTDFIELFQKACA